MILSLGLFESDWGGGWWGWFWVVGLCGVVGWGVGWVFVVVDNSKRQVYQIGITSDTHTFQHQAQLDMVGLVTNVYLMLIGLQNLLAHVRAQDCDYL